MGGTVLQQDRKVKLFSAYFRNFLTSQNVLERNAHTWQAPHSHSRNLVDSPRSRILGSSGVLAPGSVKQFVDEQDRNADREAKEIDSYGFRGAVFLEAIAARYHHSQ